MVDWHRESNTETERGEERKAMGYETGQCV